MDEPNEKKEEQPPSYNKQKILGRIILSFTQTALDYIYAIAASFQIEAIRGILIMFLGFYPLVNFIAWVFILGYLDLKYNQGEYHSIKDFFKYNWKRNIKTAVLFGFLQLFNILPFFIYLKIYNDHNTIFTEQLVELLELDRQNKKQLIDEEKSFGTYKTLKTIDLNNNNNNQIITLQNPFIGGRGGSPLLHQKNIQLGMVTLTDKNESMSSNSLKKELSAKQPSSSRGNKFIKVLQQLRVGNMQSLQQINSTDGPNLTEGSFSKQLKAFPSQNNLKSSQQGNSEADVNSTYDFQKRMEMLPSYNFEFKQNLKTQIAIEANCKFSILAVIEESYFQMLFETGEIMEMVFKSFPMFAIQLCNNILQNNWILYWFTILYFCILIIRLCIVGVIFVKFLLLNNKMVKFLDNIRYFNDEMAGDELFNQQQLAEAKKQGQKIYPMPETLEINKLSTLKRMKDLSELTARKVKNLIISINHQAKNQGLILEALNISISKFHSLQKVSLNLQHNKLGSKKISELSVFLIQSLAKCKDVSLFLDGNDLNEDELSMIKTKFDSNLSYEKFYFQSEKMVIIYDKSDTDFIVQLNTFYKRIFFEAEEFYLNATIEDIKKGSFRSVLQAPDKEGGPRNALIVDARLRQLYIIVPDHVATEDEVKILMKVLTEVQINYVEIELNFKDKHFANKLQDQASLLKFNMGFIIADFFKNGKFFKLQHSNFVSFDFSMILSNKLDMKPLSIIGSKGLSVMISNHVRLFDYSIIIPDSVATNNGIIAIINALPNQCLHLKLNLQNNMIGDLASISISAKLSKMTRLQTLYLCLRDNKYMSTTSIDMISDGLSKLTKLKELNIDFEEVDLNNKAANKFFSKLKLLKGIEILTINLKTNQIDPVQQLVVDMNKEFGTSEKMQSNDKGSFNLARALTELVNIKFLTLDISSNNIDQSGASFIHKSLASLQSLEFFNFNISNNSIKRSGILLLGMNIKKIPELKHLDLVLDYVKKPNTNMRRQRKFKKGEQRMQLEALMNSEQKPLKAIFKKISKFNKSLKDLKKYVFETIKPEEEGILKRYVYLNSNKDGSSTSDNPDDITKEMIMKYVSEVMESGARAYQITARKLSAFEDFFSKLGTMNSITNLKLSFKSNGLVNMDVKKLGICIESLKNLSSLCLNLSSNIINDVGSTLFFTSLSNHLKLIDIELNFSSNLIKFDGAYQISRLVQRLCDREKQVENQRIQELLQQKIEEQAKKKERKKLRRQQKQKSEQSDSEIYSDSKHDLENSKSKKQNTLEDEDEDDSGGESDENMESESMIESKIDEAQKTQKTQENDELIDSIKATIDKKTLPPKLLRFNLNIRDNTIDYQGGFALMEMCCKLKDSNIDVSLLMGNCGIVDKSKGQDVENKYGFFHLLKKELNGNFEFE